MAINVIFTKCFTHFKVMFENNESMSANKSNKCLALKFFQINFETRS